MKKILEYQIPHFTCFEGFTYDVDRTDLNGFGRFWYGFDRIGEVAGKKSRIYTSS